MALVNMESASTETPIVANDKQAARRVIGVDRCSEGFVVRHDGVADSGHFVGQCADRFVVVGSRLNFDRPSSDAFWLATFVTDVDGCPEHALGAMGQKHAQVLVARFGFCTASLRSVQSGSGLV
jgi:hypothetical protein